MILRTQRSTLFPYTTLFRSEAIDYFRQKRIGLEEVSTFLPGKPVELELKYRNIPEASVQVYRVDPMKLYLREKNRSEEHTSELQSHHDLVCRLLLEKKKQNN